MGRYDKDLSPLRADYTVLLGVCTGINASSYAKRTGNYPVYSFLCVKDEGKDTERRSVYECDSSDAFFGSAIAKLRNF